MTGLILENETLKLGFSIRGAELKSVFHKEKQKEILWNGNPEWWNRSAPVLFPIVGKLKDNRYFLEGKSYRMNQHGFARDLDFEVVEHKPDKIRFSLKENAKSLEMYPFRFVLLISYELSASAVKVDYEVRNPGTEPLLFSIGAHPGFSCPLAEGEPFSDYCLEFEAEEKLERCLLQNGCLNGQTEAVPIRNKQLQLAYPLFEKDALVFKKMMSESISLKNRNETYELKFSFPDFPYFGIWTKPGAPFICLEPWCGIADPLDSNGDFTSKEGMNSLEANGVFKCGYLFEIILTT